MIHSTRLMKKLVFVLLIALPLLPTFAEAAERTAVFQIAATIPIRGEQAVGTLTLTYDDSTGRGVWTFDGTIAGQPASASGGLAYQSIADDQEFSLTATSVETWNMPFGQPPPPLTISLEYEGGMASLAYDGPSVDVFGIPFALSPSPTVPLEGVFTLSDVSTGGGTPDEELPNTGSTPSTFSWRSLAAGGLATFGGMMLLGAAVLTRLRQRSGFTKRG